MAVRFFRGVRYEINVERHGHGNRIVLEVDGKELPNTIIPIPPTGTKIVKVKAILGEKDQV